MNTRGMGGSTSGSRPHNMGRHLFTGVAGTLAVGGAIFLGGAASSITAFANTGAVATSENCSTWSASVSLANNVTTDKFVDVVTTIPGTTGITNRHYDTSYGLIWSDAGQAPATGTVTLNIYNSNGEGAPGSLEFTASGSIKPATDCTSTPTIATTPAGASVPVGTAINDAATVTGTGASPMGTVTFSLFPPSNSTCSDTGTAAVFTSPPVSLVSTTPGVSTATGPTYTPTAPGTYHWVAAYSGHSGEGNNYAPVRSNCADEVVLVSKAAPAIVTTQSAGGNIGIALTDTATVSGGFNPTGTVTFTLYPPSNLTCSATGTDPVYTSPAESLSGGTASSGSYTTTAVAGAGTYQWVATYSGDANNSGVASGCTTEAVVISGGGGTLGITTPGITTPSTGAGVSITGMTLGAFLVLSGLAVALVSAIMPRRRRI
jgi:hypothetical protein